MGIKDIPLQFAIDSEEDLRAMIISYCSELGFDADEISCEDYFAIKLGHNAINIDKKVVGGRSDILIARNGKPLAIIETKAPSHDLTDEDAQQAISYARLLATIAPFAIVTNGKETKVYDVLADGLLEVENPQDSIWNKNGQKISAIADEILYKAAQTLIAINADTIDKYCKQQVANALSDLKSDIQRNKKYVPELYVERRLLNNAFAKWLTGELSIFATIAPSGYGKTNFMCAKVEEIVSTNFALFYSAGRFTKGLAESIRNDFIWEFQRESEVARILSRLDAIAQSAGKKLFIFLDAIDENQTGIKSIKNELLDFATKIRQYPNIRLILSCKSFDWSSMVIDGNQSFNLLAESITPTNAAPEKRTTTPDASKIGVHLDEFDTEELTEAVAKYKSAFSLVGDFYGELLQECRNPLMLRFVSEIYSENKEKLPTAISSLDLFDLYLRRKLEPLENSNMGEIILIKLASLIFDTGIRSLPKDQIILSLAWNDGFEKALQGLFRLGILNKTFSDEQEKIGFEFNKFFLYIYIFKVEKLQSLTPNEQVTHILELVKTSIGIEALDFYFSAVNQDVAHATLVELTKQNLPLFIQIITGLKGIDTFKKSPIPLKHISNYLQFYNYFRESFFNQLKHSTMPYADVPLGVIFIGGHHQMFRGCTPNYSQSFINVDDPELVTQFFKGPINDKVFYDLMPVGSFYVGGIHEFAEYPQKASFNHLIREVSTSLSRRLLNETSTRDILQERVYSILSDNPSFWLQGDDLPHERYWKILGYNNIEDLGNAKISELSKQVNDLLNKFSSKLKTQDDLYPSYFHRSNELFSVLFTLSQMKGDETLGHLKYSRDDLWRFYSEGFDTIINDLYQLIPIIIDNYKLLFAANFPSLIGYSQFHKNIGKLAIIEVMRSSHSDFPTLSYIIAPNIEKVPPIKIITTFQNNSLIERINFKSLYGGGYSLGGGDSGCGYIRLNVDIDGVHLEDSEAWVIQTRYPSRTPILDQAYSLISHELKYIFNARHMDWKDDLTHQLVNDQYLQLAAKSIITRQEKQSPGNKRSNL